MTIDSRASVIKSLHSFQKEATQARRDALKASTPEEMQQAVEKVNRVVAATRSSIDIISEEVMPKKETAPYHGAMRTIVKSLKENILEEKHRIDQISEISQTPSLSSGVHKTIPYLLSLKKIAQEAKAQATEATHKAQASPLYAAVYGEKAAYANEIAQHALKHANIFVEALLLTEKPPFYGAEETLASALRQDITTVVQG